MWKAISKRPATGVSDRFIKDEGGSATAFAFFVFLIMLLVGGLALDTMRHEMVRARMQATLDRAVLAGAKTHDAEFARATIEDYFAKANLSSYLEAEQDGDIDIYLNSASVSARASGTMDTYLMKLAGVETLSANGASTAEVNIPNIEAILVLDVSGSMAQGTKMADLKVGATNFVKTMLGSGAPGSVVISIVPFSFSVSPPESIFNALAVDKRHDYSTCLEFKDQDYKHASLTSGSSSNSSGIPANQMIYTSMYGNFKNLNQVWRSCYNNEYMRILPYAYEEAPLLAKIDALTPDGNTSGNEGMNWGAALLDPTFRQVTIKMINAGHLDDSLSNQPRNYGDPNTLKAIIFMGDGANTTSYTFERSNPEFRNKFSHLYEVKYTDRIFDYAYRKNNVDDKRYGAEGKSMCGKPNWTCVYKGDGVDKSVYYIYKKSNDTYYRVPSDNEVDNKNDPNRWITSSEFRNLDTTLQGYIETIQLDWEIAWGLMSPDYFSWVTDNPDAWNDYVYRDQITGSIKDTQMQNVCSATKTHGVVVYTIGFAVENGSNAERQMVKCATSSSHYYRAKTGDDLKSAFSSIASNVQNLRLTQ